MPVEVQIDLRSLHFFSSLMKHKQVFGPLCIDLYSACGVMETNDYLEDRRTTFQSQKQDNAVSALSKYPDTNKCHIIRIVGVLIMQNHIVILSKESFPELHLMARLKDSA